MERVAWREWPGDSGVKPCHLGRQRDQQDHGADTIPHPEDRCRMGGRETNREQGRGEGGAAQGGLTLPVMDRTRMRKGEQGSLLQTGE